MSTGHKVTLEEVVSKIDKLPQIPEAALRLARLLDDPDANAEEMAEIIRLDPDMTTQVLRLCNSAAYGLTRQISTVKEAVAILGLKTLKSLVYVIISKMALDKPVKGYGLEKGELWYNSLACAVYSKNLAQNLGGVDPELAFTAALLRDIGKIVLGEYVGPSYKNIEEMAIRSQIPFDEAEFRVIGISHSEVGKHIAQKWNLPEDLITVIEFKNKPSNFATSPLASMGKPGLYKLVTIVHLADAFVKMIGSGLGDDGLMYTLDQEALDKLGVKVDVQFMDSTLARLIQFEEIINDMANSLKKGGA